MFDFLTSPDLILFARLCLGGVFIVGGIGKVRDTPTGVAAVAAQVPWVPPALARLGATVLPWVEIAVGALLVLGLGLRPAGLVAFVMLVGFTIVVARDVLRGSPLACNCFGSFSSKTERATEWTVLRDLFLLALAGLIAYAPSRFLALDALVLPGSVAGPSLADAVPVALLAVAAVFFIVLGGMMVSTIRSFLRAF